MSKRTPVRLLAVAALAGSAAAGSLLAASGSASAAKSPVAATCSAVAGAGTVAAVTGGQPATSVLTGCSGGKSTPTAVSVSVLASSLSSGTTTISWTNKKTTTYSFTVATNSSVVCPTFLGQSAADKETITVSNLGGTAKITAGGGFDVCAYVGSDGTLYEASVGTVTI